jgi:trans-aconitate methyltransferase
MTEYEQHTYGDEIAGMYDQLYPDADPACIDLLAQLAGTGPALELGIGTGRIALPLRQRGVEVEGIDASREMVAKLQAKEGGLEIPVHLGSFEQFALGRDYRLVYVVFNTFFNLPGQEEQVRCFQSIAGHLSAEGCFLIEAFVPDPGRFTDFQSVRLVDITRQTLRLEVSYHDPVAQRVKARHVMVSEEGLRFCPVEIRYAWPSELDLMARVAGLQLRERWGSWSRDSFTRDSTKHISLYGRAP